ncbi:hypothetical protein ARALYDRAFT_342703 [Arabidopsis lyrata subsp. lyrata]|uniref:Uncharacterized protein n=1 Tax=Arabidopsis lyrata subsp. lyrata TaxID=81972 RepID=D7L6T4_ARALL|nr:hypothetical protein ARALYDRAFT_342703 [Arabidopsis lyrata subsp. lyrata]
MVLRGLMLMKIMKKLVPISVLLESLRKLQLMSLNLDILKVLRFFFQSTEIGKAVNDARSEKLQDLNKKNSKLLMQTQSSSLLRGNFKRATNNMRTVDSGWDIDE